MWGKNNFSQLLLPPPETTKWLLSVRKVRLCYFLRSESRGCCSLRNLFHLTNSKSVWKVRLQRTCLITGFTCHSDGSSALVYAPQHQTIISCGKKGDVCLFDVRQRQLRHTFHAHDSTIKCMALDPMEQFFVTGSADGDIKVRKQLNAFIFSSTEINTSNVKAHVLCHWINCIFLCLTDMLMTFTGLELECPQPNLLIPRRTFQEHHIPQCPGLGCVAGLLVRQWSTLLLWVGWFHESTPITR